MSANEPFGRWEKVVLRFKSVRSVLRKFKDVMKGQGLSEPNIIINRRPLSTWSRVSTVPFNRRV